MGVNSSLSVAEFDNRADNQTFVFTIRNNTDDRINLVRTKISLAPGARTVDAVDDSASSLVYRFDSLKTDLSQIVNTAIADREKGRHRWRAAFSVLEAIIVRLPFFALSFEPGSAQHPMVEIQNATDAQRALDRWLTERADALIRGVFEFKLNQMRDLETQIMNVNSPAVTTIDPGQSLDMPYVVYFQRAPFDSRRFLIKVSSDFYGSNKLVSTTSASAPVRIAGSAWGLSLASVVFGALGAIVRISAIDKGDVMVQSTWVSSILPSTLIALFVFNVYERLNLKSSGALSPNWRSALFLGFVVGLFQSRIIAALSALVGVFPTGKP